MNLTNTHKKIEWCINLIELKLQCIINTDWYEKEMYVCKQWHFLRQGKSRGSKAHESASDLNTAWANLQGERETRLEGKIYKQINLRNMRNKMQQEQKNVSII